MAKMIDVARHAGVSLKTVSRVLNNEPHVQDVLRNKVRQSVRELGYIPSASARSLRSNRTYCMHLFSPSDRNTYVHAIQFGASLACQEHGYRLITSILSDETTRDADSMRTWFKNLVESGTPDGVILVAPHSNEPFISEIISEFDIPIVRIGPNDIKDDNFTVTIDDQAAAGEAANYLIGLGHERIGFIRGSEDQGATEERFLGYRRALLDQGLTFNPELIAPGNFLFESGLRAGEHFLEMSEPPTAIFAANDDMAAGVLVAAHSLQISVPEKLSIIGFDDSIFAEKIWPALTTIRQPLQEFGAEAIELLITVARQSPKLRNGKTHFLPYEFISRQSTAPPGELSAESEP